MTIAALTDWKVKQRARRLAAAQNAAQNIPLARSSLGIMRQNAAQVLGFAASHRRKAAVSLDPATRKKWARAWLASARAERIARA